MDALTIEAWIKQNVTVADAPCIVSKRITFRESGVYNLGTWEGTGIVHGRVNARPMSVLATTRMSSKGQVVIPEDIRNRLGLRAGDRFVVVGDRDVVILKSISPPPLDEFDDLIAEAQKPVREARSQKSDVEK